MHADDTSMLNIGQDINELQKRTSENTGLVEQYFETSNLSIHPTKTHYILFQKKQCRQESELMILIKNREIVNVNSTNFCGVTIDSNLGWEVHIERTCSRISHRLSKMWVLDMNIRRIVHYGLIYSFWHMESVYGDRMQRH
jgi:hypothetical protein